MTVPKLDTSEDVLDWAMSLGQTGCGCCSSGNSKEDLADAEYIAGCVRVRKYVDCLIQEHAQSEPPDPRRADLAWGFRGYLCQEFEDLINDGAK